MSELLKTSVTLEVNKEYYFIPEEVVGVSTVGIGSTIVFSNPGVGITQKFIPAKQIYLPNHGLDVNDRLYYNKQGGTANRCMERYLYCIQDTR